MMVLHLGSAQGVARRDWGVETRVLLEDEDEAAPGARLASQAPALGQVWAVSVRWSRQYVLWREGQLAGAPGMRKAEGNCA